MTLYLDYNATTPVDKNVLETMLDIYKNHYGNAGSRTHIYGQKANEIVTSARESVAKLLKTDKKNVIFTSGATESNNIGILGLADWGEKTGKKHIVSTKIEHKSVLEPLEQMEKKGFVVDYINVDSSGRVDKDKLLARVRPDTLLVTAMHANNETGIIQPVEEIGEALDSTDTFFHVDAAQTFGKLVNDLQKIKYDLLSISGHKIYGPQGIGALIIKTNNYERPPVKPITFGGGQERGLRPGTLPVALIAGLGKVADLSIIEYKNWDQNNQIIKDSILEQLSGIKYTINGDPKHCLPHVINISFPGVDSEALMIAVQETHAISNGSACTSHDYKPSHVLTAMGLDSDLVDSAVRLSWADTTEIDLTNIINAILDFS